MSLRGEATIGKLTMRCRAGHDSGRQRNELQLLLDGADFRPRGLPPSCILVVRSLPDPLPGNLRDRRCRYRVSREWERGARAHLEERLRGAARPDRSVISNKCEAVVFRDEAELLACLALDVARGNASDKWWWQVVKVPRFRDLPSVLMEDVSLLPAILDVLDEWGVVDKAVEALSLEEVVEIAARMTTALGGPALGGMGAVRDAGIDVIERPRRYDEARRLVAEVFPKPTNGSREALSRAAFIGISLALFRHATVARTPAFASAVRQWWADSWVRKTRAGRPIPKGSTGPEKLSEQTPQGEGRGMPATNPEPKAESNAEAEAVPYEGAHARAPRVEGEEQALVADPERSPKIAAILDTGLESQHPAERAEETPPVNAPVGAEISEEIGEPPTRIIGKLERPGELRASEPSGKSNLPTAAPISPPVEEAPDGASSIAAPFDRSSFSQSLVANLPFEEGFTTELGGVFYLITALVELDPPRALSSWALLEFLSSALLPDEIYDQDPIWTALRELDGRVADVPPPSEACEWLSPHLPELREHLREIAAECDPVPLAEFELAPIVVQRARVVVSRTHIDVLFCLDQILLPVRRAGLDRDPGWLPEFGRVIRFHFR